MGDCEGLEQLAELQDSFLATKAQAGAYNVIGPTLRFNTVDLDQRLWRGSALFVLRSDYGQPKLTYDTPNNAEMAAQCTMLDAFDGYSVYRFLLDIPVADTEQSITYRVHYDNSHTADYTFYIAGYEQAWHWAFYSCNGFEAKNTDLAKYGDIGILWTDLLKCSKDRHMHVMVGGGDQIYNDPVWQIPELVQWLEIKDCKQRALTDQPGVEEAASRYYFAHYCEHWSTPAFKEALATIPSLMTWDDHDICDGWGSYPQYLQDCAVFQQVFRAARRFYLLFQQHATLETAEDVGLLGAPNAFSWIAQLGPRNAILGPDTRAQRNRGRIINPEHWDMLTERLKQLPTTTEQLMVVFAVPFLYGEIPASEAVMDMFHSERRGKVRNWLTVKTGVLGGLLSAFGEPGLADDINDHFTSKIHIHERDMMLHWFADFAGVHKVRVTYCSGDVHVGAFCRATSNPDTAEPLPDGDYMLQVISSAIGNAPPPPVLGKILNAPMTTGRRKIDDRLWTHFLQLFKEQYPANKKVLLKRNWCDCWEATDGMHYQLRAEDEPGNKETPIYTFETKVPSLKPTCCPA